MLFLAGLQHIQTVPGLRHLRPKRAPFLLKPSPLPATLSSLPSLFPKESACARPCSCCWLSCSMSSLSLPPGLSSTSGTMPSRCCTKGWISSPRERTLRTQLGRGPDVPRSQIPAHRLRMLRHPRGFPGSGPHRQPGCRPRRDCRKAPEDSGPAAGARFRPLFTLEPAQGHAQQPAGRYRRTAQGDSRSGTRSGGGQGAHLCRDLRTRPACQP